MTSWWDIPNKDNIKPVDYLKEHGGTTNDAQMAELLSELASKTVSLASVTQKRHSLGIMKPKWGVKFVESQHPKLDGCITVETDNALVISDLHIQFQDAGWLERVVAFAQRHNIRICIIAGDLVDLTVLSTFVPSVLGAGAATPTLDGELEDVSNTIAILLTVFDEVIILLGNHEIRLARKLGNTTVTVFKRTLGADSEHVRVSEYHYCIIQSSYEPWRITHPRNASAVPVRVASQLADKYRMNVVAAHGHDWGMTTSVSGYYACACGMIADPERIDYTNYIDNTRPFMAQGAWALVEGEPILLHPKWAKPERL